MVISRLFAAPDRRKALAVVGFGYLILIGIIILFMALTPDEAYGLLFWNEGSGITYLFTVAVVFGYGVVLSSAIPVIANSVVARTLASLVYCISVTTISAGVFAIIVGLLLTLMEEA